MNIWAQAKSMAQQTPPERNRYVDFLRSVSILVVIIGHWLIATGYYHDGVLTPGHLLESSPGVQWLTWIFQVMPIFFIVGGYSNAVSLESAKRKGIDYAGWLAARLNRLVAPLLILIIAWAAIALVMEFSGVDPKVIQYASQASLIPTWFLAIYIVVVVLAPVTYRFWKKLGFKSFWIFVLLAVLNDMAFFMLDMKWLGWLNFFWVWLGVHQLGYAWRDDRMARWPLLLLYSALAFAGLAALIFYGPYPMAMVGSPDEGVSNSSPPKITMMLLGVAQFGLLLSLESPMRKYLDNLRLWAATVMVNGLIMTVYLWHITVMVLVVAVLYMAGGIFLDIVPASKEWWLTRPLWIAGLMAILLPVALILSGLERPSPSRTGHVPSAVRQVIGAMMIGLGVALLSKFGYGGGPIAHMDIGAFGLVVVGCGISGLLPGFRK